MEATKEVRGGGDERLAAAAAAAEEEKEKEKEKEEEKEKEKEKEEEEKDDTTTMRDFPMERLTPLKRVLLIGGTTCGKTTALYEIIRAMHKNGKRSKKGVGIQFALGFSKTENANGNLGGPVKDDDGNVLHKHAPMPQFCANHGYDEGRLAEFMDYQIQTKAVGRMKQALVIGDDVMSQKGIRYSKVLDEFQQNARNYGCGAIWSTHSVKQMSVDARSQFHFVFCYELARSQMLNFFEEFGSRVGFKSFKAFANTWNRITTRLGKYWALVIDLDGRHGSRLVDRVFKFRAADPTAAGYHVPHICEAGFWWINARLAKRAARVSIRQLFDLAALAERKGLNLGAHNMPAIAAAGGGAAAGSVAGGGANTQVGGEVEELMV